MKYEYRVLLVEKKNKYAIVKMNRPEKLNAANTELFGELAACMKALDKDPEVGCIILTGQTFETKKGPRAAFSAGADVVGFENLDDTEAGYTFIKACFEPFRAIEEIDTPVIAAVNGMAFGFGLEIMGACDLSFCSRSARFALKELNHGAVPAWTVTRGLEKLGKGVVAYLCMSAREVPAEEAKRLGLVIDVYEDAELLPKCEELAERIAKNSSISVTYIKKILNRRYDEDYGDAERFMPTIFATKFMQQAFSRFRSGETKHVK